MIEDPREVERRRLLGIEDPDTPTREDLADALEQVSSFIYLFILKIFYFQRSVFTTITEVGVDIYKLNSRVAKKRVDS